MAVPAAPVDREAGLPPVVGELLPAVPAHGALSLAFGCLLRLAAPRVFGTAGEEGIPAYLGKASWLDMPAAIWICVLLFAIGASALAWLRHGRALYAIGGNAEAARAAGIRVDRIVWIVLILGSVLAAFAGILYSGHYGSVSATQGSGWIFQVFAATVIGGVSLNGGKGSVFGALTLQLVVNLMTLAGVPPLWNQFLNGAVIIVALIISRFASGEKQE
ncbi:ribose/xylose/arabinose/galactoside ABC-type transport system permease subunit [Streptomyces turgidiscabies]|uniref:Autoinducer 2 import system permease protein LsrC n=1 Tax=Streptomyces turgidiscabies TaxID=85558 RepID=A0ABU0RTF4_9ACTN|nr:ribose/xylose/arabinose/galactoside ABC-type transport system permease subunit [Streptomyces turgidiscabies]